MKIATCHLESLSPYSQSKHHSTPKLDKELPKDYEARTWRERCHFTEEGQLFIPPTAFKNCLSEAAKYLSIQIPGKAKNTYTKHFEAGVMVTEPLLLPYQKEKIEGEWLFLNADGKRGSGKRVEKCYPKIPKWEGEVQFLILDETITEDPFKQHLEGAGSFIGIGRFRPRNNGFYGRFRVVSVKWK